VQASLARREMKKAELVRARATSPAPVAAS
jgi:hypothetical protein